MIENTNEKRYVMPEMSAIVEWFDEYCDKNYNCKKAIYLSSAPMSFHQYDLERSLLEPATNELNDNDNESLSDFYLGWIAYHDKSFHNWCRGNGLEIEIGTFLVDKDQLEHSKQVKLITSYLTSFLNKHHIKYHFNNLQKLVIDIEPEPYHQKLFHGDWSITQSELTVLAKLAK